MLSGYYDRQLAAERLRRCYEIASPAVRAYLEAEIEHLAGRVASLETAAGRVLELGCGYGRVLARVARPGLELWGIDTSLASLRLAARSPGPRAHLAAMNAVRLGFRDGAFDAVACVQNGISAFGADRLALLREAVRVTRPGGLVLFSSYAARFWPERLAWFEAQAAHGLIGEIDRDTTGDGIIVGKDGFRATTVGPAEFRRLAAALGLEPRLEEVGGSSLFCELRPR